MIEFDTIHCANQIMHIETETDVKNTVGHWNGFYMNTTRQREAYPLDSSTSPTTTTTIMTLTVYVTANVCIQKDAREHRHNGDNGPHVSKIEMLALERE